MESLIETFHIDASLLIAQIVNFALVVGVLYFFLLKPLLRTMGDRSARIEKSLEDAARIDRELKESEEKYQEMLAAARKEANALIEEAKTAAEAKRTIMLNQAKDELERVVAEGKERLKEERESVLKGIRGEVADLVADGIAKVLGEKHSQAIDRESVRNIIDK